MTSCLAAIFHLFRLKIITILWSTDHGEVFTVIFSMKGGRKEKILTLWKVSQSNVDVKCELKSHRAGQFRLQPFLCRDQVKKLKKSIVQELSLFYFLSNGYILTVYILYLLHLIFVKSVSNQIKRRKYYMHLLTFCFFLNHIMYYR